MSGYEVQRVTTYVEYETVGEFDTFDEAKAYADEQLEVGPSGGAEIAYEVLETTGTLDRVVYEVAS